MQLSVSHDDLPPKIALLRLDDGPMMAENCPGSRAALMPDAPS